MIFKCSRNREKIDNYLDANNFLFSEKVIEIFSLRDPTCSRNLKCFPTDNTFLNVENDLAFKWKNHDAFFINSQIKFIDSSTFSSRKTNCNLKHINITTNENSLR